MTDLALAYDADETRYAADEVVHDGLVGDVVALGAEPVETLLSLEELAAPTESGLTRNLVEVLDDEIVSKIVTACRDGYTRDCISRETWVEDYDAGMEMIRGVREAKSTPFEGASNVKFPLLTDACVRFNARAYPAIINGPDLVRSRVLGDDPDGQKAARGARVAEHMSWQLLEDMPEWEDETDALLLHLPAAGHAYRQYTWNAHDSRPRSEFVTAKRIVVNNDAADLQTVPLITKEFERYRHELVTAERRGEYVLGTDFAYTGEEGDAQEMLEHHCRYDLDDDGYPEPYIVTVHKESQRAVRIEAGFWPKDILRDAEGVVVAVKRRVLFAPYRFIPDPEGGFHGIGFGRLLREHNDVINSTLNQLMDAATEQNAGGGFIGNGVNFGGGEMTFRPGEWKYVNVSGAALAQNIVPMPWRGPSAVLYQLLLFLIESGQQIGSVTEALTGNAPANTQPTTLLAQIEQGQQVFSAVFKRFYRGLTGEFRIVRELNGAFLSDEDYIRYGDGEKYVARADYESESLDVAPVADPSITTVPQRMAQAQFLATKRQDPLYDPVELEKRILALVRVPDSAALLKKQDAPDPAQMLQAEQAATEVAKAQAEIKRLEAQTEELTQQAQVTAGEAEKLRRELGMQDLIADEARVASDLTGGMGGMGGPGGDPPIQEGAGGLRGGPETPVDAGLVGGAGPDFGAGAAGQPGASAGGFADSAGGPFAGGGMAS